MALHDSCIVASTTHASPAAMLLLTAVNHYVPCLGHFQQHFYAKFHKSIK
jgi:hypothetical protein